MLPALFLFAASLCTLGTDACTEQFPVGAPGRFQLLYRSHSLTQPNPDLRHALVVVHGASRNPENYFPSGTAGAFLAGKLETTLVIAPRFASRNDKLAAGEIAYATAGDDWRGGGPAVGLPEVTAAGVIDKLLAHLNNKQLYPNLQSIVLFGHSAGGQFVNRYVAISKYDSPLPVTYVVSNPSSYLYFDSSRPAPNPECKAFNNWKYGLEGRANTEDFIANSVRRPVVYLLGEYDITPQFSFDASCSAMTQGPNRFERGINYLAYINGKYKAKHRVVKVPNCGHNGRCMLVADEARPVLFP
jgi:hypothetical protein